MLSGKRSLVVAYLLWFVAGPIGAHRLYVRRYGSALALVVLFLVCGTISFVLMNEAAFIPVALWLFLDLLFIPGLIRSCNGNVRAR